MSLHTATGDNTVQVGACPGRVNYLHASAADNAIFAHLIEEQSRRLSAGGA